MPAGCEFVCQNEECEHKDKGFIITGTWGLGEMAVVINSRRVSRNKEFKEELGEWQKAGKLTCSIPYPNNEDLPVVGCRVQLWCGKCEHIFTQEFLYDADDVERGDPEYNSLLEKHGVLKECPQCSGALKRFDEITEEGINCPLCKDKMEQHRWFSNERDEEYNERRNQNA